MVSILLIYWDFIIYRKTKAHFQKKKLKIKRKRGFSHIGSFDNKRHTRTIYIYNKYLCTLYIYIQARTLE